MDRGDLPPLSPDPDVLFQHTLEHRWRLRALDLWRAESDKRVSTLESSLLSEREARVLREALANALDTQAAGRWTRSERVGGLMVAALMLAEFVRGFV